MSEESAITSDQIAHLAQLSRIAMSDEELTGLADDLGTIIEAVAQVKEAVGEDTPATSHPIPLTNVLRPDVVGPVLTPEQALSGAPAQEDSKFLVPQMLGED